jgi:hypothetical protein
MSQTVLPRLSFKQFSEPPAASAHLREKLKDVRFFAAAIIMGFDDTKFLNGVR